MSNYSNSRFVLIGEAARLLNVSTSTVRRLGERGELQEYRDCNRRRQYCREEVQRLHAARSPRIHQ